MRDINTSEFISLLRLNGFERNVNFVRDVLRSNPEIGYIFKKRGKQSGRYMFYSDKVDEFILLKKNEHTEYYKLRSLAEETNFKNIDKKKWHAELLHIITYKMHIHPVKLYGRRYLKMADAWRVKREINPIRSNVKK
jgi:glycerol kinase